MAFVVVLVILMALGLLGLGMLLLINNKWLPKLSIFMGSKPPEPSARLRIAIWKLRALGIFYIMLSIIMFIMVASPDTNATILLSIALIAYTANFVLGIVWAHQTRKEKADQKNLSDLINRCGLAVFPLISASLAFQVAGRRYETSGQWLE
jgi:hypothetical protein